MQYYNRVLTFTRDVQKIAKMNRVLIIAILISSFSLDGVSTSTCSNITKWQLNVGKAASGGTQIDNIVTRAACLDRCVQDIRCVAADVGQTGFPPECWLHFSSSYLDRVYDQPGTNQYQLIRCSTTPQAACVEDTWELYTDQTSVGANQYVGPRTIQQCLDYCSNTSNCVGVDIDVNVVPLGCWPHLRADDLTFDNTFEQRGTNQYRLISGCANKLTRLTCYNPEWSVFTNLSSTGGVQQAGPKSVQECMDYCGLMAAGCVAVDVDLNQSPPICWLHLSMDYLKPSFVYVQPGINQYRLVTKCVDDPIRTSTTTTTVAPTFKPDGSCSTWQVLRDQSSVGASEYLGPRTIKQCLDYCNSNTRCVAVDIDVNVVPLGCWVHVDANDLSADNTYDQRGTNQYILGQRCLNSTAVSGCYNPDWSVSLGQSSTGGIQQAGTKSVQECLDYCGLMAAGCVAVDVDLSQSPPECWLHVSTDDLKPSNVYPQQGVNQYRLQTRCFNNSAQASTTTTTVSPLFRPDGSCSTWRVIRAQTSVGASEYLGPRTIKQCLDYCNSNTRCVAVDIDVNVVPLGCWVHIDANDLTADNTYDQRGTNQYILEQRCLNSTAVSGCYNPDWSVTLNQSSANGVEQAGPTSVQECLDYCGLMAAGCVAVDVDLSQSPPVCWLHLYSDNLKPSNVFPQPGVNQYRLIATCTNNSAQASTTTTTVAPILKPGLPDGLCSTWQVLRDQSSVGASEYLGPRTIKQCLDYCNSNTRCVAVDIDVNVVPLGCWVHVDANDLTADNTYDQRGTNQYILGQRCLNSTESPACYNPDWLVLLSRSSAGGVQQFGPTSVQECLDVCGGMPTCLAADVDLSASPLTCWLHSSSNYSLAGNISPRPGINQYRLITKCANYSVLTTTTTTTTTTAAPAISPDIRSCASWDVLRNQNSIGASEYLGPRSIEQCLNYCNNNTQCVAVEIDVNVVPLKCWVHYDADNLDADNTYYQKGTNQYVIKQRCLNGTVSTSCYNPDWSVLMNQSSVNGVRQFGPASVQECLDVCGHSATCSAVDVDLNQSPPTCWLYSNITNLLTMFSRPGINQYRLLSNCTRSPVITTTTTTASPPVDIDGELWMVVRNRVSTGAFPYVGPRTIQQCLDYCNSQLNCVAVDIDVNVVPVGCWIHASSIDLSPNNTYFQQGTNQYISVRKTPNKPAPTICYNPDWFVIADQSAAGAVQQFGPESVQECLDVCGHSATCSAVDVDLNQSPPTCWLYSNVTNLLTMFSRPGINQYRLLSNCTRSPVITTTTTTASPPVDIDGELWMVVRNRVSTGAFPYVGPRTIQQCLDYCNSQLNCVAVDIDVNVVPVGCWIHASSIDLSPNNTYFQQGTNQYISVRKTPNKPAPTICYNPDWFVIADQSAAGAVQQFGPESVQECLDVCGHSATCSAVDVDLNQSPPTCWLYSNVTNLLTMYARPGINQYRLRTNCTESSLLSTQSPIIPTISVTDVMRSTSTGATGEKNVALIVGLTVGLGVPLIIILTVLIIIFCCYRTPSWSSKDEKPSTAPPDVESTPSVISATPSSSSSRAPIVGSSSQTHKPETSNYFYWAPERPEGTADLDRAYSEENTE